MSEPAGELGGRPTFSVVIPTYERRELVLRCVRSLFAQDYAGSYEVVVVVDGSRDGSVDALQALEAPVPFVVLEQANRGASAARNAGAAVARGRFLLFLDDDMECDPGMLGAHHRSLMAGADAVLGHLPVHPDSPSSILIEGLADWARERLDRLSAPDAELSLHDLLTGQLSVSRVVFNRLGGFAGEFTRDGSFGNEDVDFGYRLLKHGHRIVFNPEAVSWQRYEVHPRELLKRYRQAGQADVVFARTHPEKADELFELNEYAGWMDRRVWRPLASLPFLGPALSRLCARLALWRIEKGSQDNLTRWIFGAAWRLEYWSGVGDAGGIPRASTMRVLAYHAIQDLEGCGEIEQYGVPLESFLQQLDVLERGGYQFVSADDLLHLLRSGTGLPRKAVLLTFDDAYEDLVQHVLPVLEGRGIPAVVFAVADRIGETNEWDRHLGAPPLRLLDGEGLRRLERAGIEVGAHSRTHRSLTELSDREVEAEVVGSVRTLTDLGLRQPRLFSYPYGMSSAGVERVVREAGLDAAFSIRPGKVHARSDPFRLPRIEILRSDRGWRFRWKLMWFGLVRLPLWRAMPPAPT